MIKVRLEGISETDGAEGSLRERLTNSRDCILNFRGQSATHPIFGPAPVDHFKDC